MNSYQKLKQKYKYLQSQVDIFQQKCKDLQSQIDMFKNALIVVRKEPQVVEDFSKDFVSYTMKMQYAIRENEINEELKRRLNHWVAFNLDKETIERLLKLKEEELEK